MYGDYVEIDVDVLQVMDTCIVAYVNGNDEKREIIGLGAIKDSDMFLEADESYTLDVLEVVAYKNGWI